MRLNNLLKEEEFENTRWEELKVFIQKHCVKFMIECAEKNIILWRGSNKSSGNPEKVWEIYPSRIFGGRRPMSTSEFIHDLANKKFIEKFGWPVRDGVFTTKDFGVADGYGRAYIFIPVDNYQYAWSPKIRDFYMYVTGETLDLKHFDVSDGAITMYSLWMERWGPKTRYKDAGEWRTIIDNVTIDQAQPPGVISMKSPTVGDETILGIYHKNKKNINIYWKPAVSLYQFKKEKNIDLEEEVGGIVNTYTGKVLDAAPEKHEILFNCDKYIMIWVPKGFGAEKDKVISEYQKILREYK